MKCNIAILLLLLAISLSISKAQHLRATREVADASEIDPSQASNKETASPTDTVSHAPSPEPTTPPNPSTSPTLMPTTSSPTPEPTTPSPSTSPTIAPSTSSPTQSPTLSPTVVAPPAPGRDQIFAIVAGNNAALSVDTGFFCDSKFLLSEVFFAHPRNGFGGSTLYTDVRFRWKYDPDTKRIESLACPGKVLDIIDCGRGSVNAYYGSSSSSSSEDQQWGLEFLGGEQWAIKNVLCQRFLLSGSPAHIGNSEEEKSGFTLQIIQ